MIKKIKNLEEIFFNLGFLGVILFSLGLMVSKSLMNIGLGLMGISSLIFIKNIKIKGLRLEYRVFILILVFTPLFSLFSPGGKESFIVCVEKSYRYLPIFFIPIFLNSISKIKIVIFCVYTTIVVNFFNGILFYKSINWNFKVRYQSFGNNLLDDAHMFVMLSFIVLSIIYFCIKNKKIKLGILSGFVYGITLIGILLSQSRGSWLALIITWILFIIMIVNDLKKVGIIIAISVCVALGISKTEKFQNNHYISRFKSIKNLKSDSPRIRTLMWEASIYAYTKSPIFGVGRDNLPNYALEYFEKNNKYEQVSNKSALKDIAIAGNPHNMYFSSFSEEGLVSVLLFSFWGIVWVKQIFLIRKLKKDKKKIDDFLFSLLIGCSCLTFAFYISGMTENVWRNFWKANTYLLGISLYFSIENYYKNMLLDK